MHGNWKIDNTNDALRLPVPSNMASWKTNQIKILLGESSIKSVILQLAMFDYRMACMF